jgi:hypothetical protein
VKLDWSIRTAIKTATLRLCLLGPHSYDEAQRLAIAEVAKAERLKAASRPPTPKPPPHMSPEARGFWEKMMTPLTLTREPSGPTPIAAPRPTHRKARATTGEPKLSQPHPVEPQLPTPLLYVSGGPRSSAQNITDEFRNDPATANWRADERARGLL